MFLIHSIIDLLHFAMFVSFNGLPAFLLNKVAEFPLSLRGLHMRATGP